MKSFFKDFAILFFLVVLGMMVHQFSKQSDGGDEETEQTGALDEKSDELNENSLAGDEALATISDEENSDDAEGELSQLLPHLNSITLGVQNIESSRYFYEEVLQWPSSSISSENIVFIQAGSMLLNLYPVAMMLQDNSSERSTIKLSYLVESKEKVDLIFTDLKEKCVDIKKPPSSVFWGGYSGSFADPDGYTWEIAYNPHLKLNNNGEIVLPK